MRYFRLFALPALALAFSGANGLMALDRDWDDRGGARYDRADTRQDYRDMRRDYARRERLLADIDHDRRQMNEAIRRGKYRAADRFEAELRRDQRALAALERDMRLDRREMRSDAPYLNRDDRGYADSFRPR